MSDPEEQQACVSCGWIGLDNEIIKTPDGDYLLCMACQMAATITQEVKTVGKMTPVMLVPLIRSCVSQSVGAIVAQVMRQLAETTGAQEFESLVNILQAGGTPPDPN